MSVLEAELEALYPDSGLVMDSKHGGPNVESMSVASAPELGDLGGVGSILGNQGIAVGIQSRGSETHGCGPGFLALILPIPLPARPLPIC